jgi:hypothetical protein
MTGGDVLKGFLFLKLNKSIYKEERQQLKLLYKVMVQV